MALIEIPFWILVLLFSSGDPTAKKVGWGILGFIVAFCALVSMGASGGVAVAVIVVVAVIIIIILVASDSSKSSGGGSSSSSVKYTGKGSDIVLPNQRRQQQPMATTADDFDTQLANMKNQARNVTGQQLETANKGASVAIHTAEPVNRFTEDVLGTYQKYAVPENAQKVLITVSQIANVNECPAVMWSEEGKLHVLALLREPILNIWSIATIPVILFEKIENEKQRASFEQLKKEPIGKEFSELILSDEDSHDEKNIDGVFTLPNGVKVTRTSGKSLFTVLPDIPFYYVDGITQSQWYPSELRDLYQQHILLETGVLSQEQYDEKSNVAVSEYISKEKDDSKAKQHLKEFQELGLIGDELYSKYLNMING
ncbi:MAG: hypothetical protein EOM34_16140 [Clostridia bacterium]|nr:hypothetical protein [Clostridia bacterium]